MRGGSISLFKRPRKWSAIAALLAALKACSRQKDLEGGRIIHGQASAMGEQCNIYVATALLDMYAKCGSMVEAQRVFDAMLDRDIAAWNALILGYTENGEPEIALDLLACCSPAPNSRTLIAGLMACASLAKKNKQNLGAALIRGREIHSAAAAVSGVDLDMFLASAVMNMYSKCGSMVEARRVFDGLCSPNVVCWNTMIVGYADNGEYHSALQIFGRMLLDGACFPDSRTLVAALAACGGMTVNREEGIQAGGHHHHKSIEAQKLKSIEQQRNASRERARSIQCMAMADDDGGGDGATRWNIYVANALLDVYSKCGSMGEARAVFDRMPGHDVVSWNTLMLGYVENGDCYSALELFWNMTATPNTRTFVAAIKACCSFSLHHPDRFKAVQSRICRCGMEDDPFVASSLVDFLCKCGDLSAARFIFDSVAARELGNLVLWNAMLGGYSRGGDTEQVFSLFEMMVRDRDDNEQHCTGLQPDGFTFLSLLTACSHAGLVERGRHYFDSMLQQYGVPPGIHHCHCMVDLLGRGNHLEEAVEMVKSMPYAADAVTWTTLLAAAHKWNDLRIGSYAFQSLMKLECGRRESTSYLLMANICGKDGFLLQQSEEQLKSQANEDDRSKSEDIKYQKAGDLLSRYNY